MNFEKKEGFLKRKNVHLSMKVYLIDTMSSMALGLFASLLIGTIMATIGDKFNIPQLIEVADFAKSATGAAIGVAIAYSLQAPPLVMFSAASVGLAANALGGPACAFVAVIIATEFGKIVSKETKIDIIMTPSVTIVTGVLVSKIIGPVVSAIMTGLGEIIMRATEMQPLLMGALVSVIVGIVLTLPISSAALCIMLNLSGIAAGAATAGCSAQMIGFAIASYKENGVGGLFAQGIGTSMLQVPNIVKNPKIWIAPIVTSAITGSLATTVFKLENIPAGAGMGTSGLVGPFGVFTAMGTENSTIIAVLLICFILPATLTFIFDKIARKLGIVSDGDMKLDL